LEVRTGKTDMTRIRTVSTFSNVARRALGATCAFLLLAAVNTDCAKGASNDISFHSLAEFNFEGLSFSDGVAQMKQRFPSATVSPDKLDEALGRERYVVTQLKTADLARIFFFDGKLYQFGIVYEADRLKNLGGMEALLLKLVGMLGPADHAGESRWTWQQPSCGRRADLYTTRDGALLVITDMNLIPVVEKRTQQIEKTKAADLGF
jgi:hypothetical protein